MRSWAIPGLGDGDTLGGDAGSELDVFGPVDGEDVGAAGIFAVGADAIDSAAAGAEGLHEAGVIQGWPVVTVEEIQLAADDVLSALCFAPFVLVMREDADSDIEIGVEQERGELVARDANGGGARETGNHLRVMADRGPCGQADHEAIGHHTGIGGEGLDLRI